MTTMSDRRHLLAHTVKRWMHEYGISNGDNLYRDLDALLPAQPGQQSPPTVPGWLPIEDLPKCSAAGGRGFEDDRSFIVCNSAGFRAIATYISPHLRATYDTPEGEIDVCTDVRLWMPLPPPPTEAKTEGKP